MAILHVCRQLPPWHECNAPTCQCKRPKRNGFDPWFGKIPWRRTQQPTPVLLPGETQGWKTLAGYSPWHHKELDTTEQLSTHTLKCTKLFPFSFLTPPAPIYLTLQIFQILIQQLFPGKNNIINDILLLHKVIGIVTLKCCVGFY